MFVQNPIIGLLGLIVLPVIFFYFNKFRGKLFFLYLIFSLSFLGAPIQLLLGINTNFLEQIIELIIFFLFIVTIFNKKNTQFKYFRYCVLFILISLFSFFINEVSWIQLILFLRKYLVFIVLFWIVDNLNADYRKINNFINFLITLFILQIVINILRFPMTGISEEYIGSLAVRGGSLTAIISLLGACFSFAYYCYTREKKYLLLVIGFFMFGVIGSKRIVVILLPLALSLTYILYLVKIKKIYSLIYRLPIYSVFFILIIYAGVRLSPTLNPENEIGGTFDYYHIVDYIYDYSNPGKKVLGAKYYGRGEAPLAVYNLLVYKYRLENFLLGLGPGDIIMSNYIDRKDRSIKRIEDITASKYDIGYGARTGFLFTGLQIGLLGVLAFLIMCGKVYFYYIKLAFYKFKIKKNNSLALGVIMSFVFFLIDFFMYSRVLYESIPTMLFIFIIMKFIEINYNLEKKDEEVD